MKCVIIIEGPGIEKQERLIVVGRPLTVGREASCDIQIDTPDVSRKHATLQLYDTKLSVTDSSANGTWVNGKKILKTIELSDIPAELQIVKIKLRVSLPGDKKTDTNSAPSPQPEAQVRAGDPSRQQMVAFRKKVHRTVLEELDLVNLDRNKIQDDAMRKRVQDALRMVIERLALELPKKLNVPGFMREMTNEILGLGPLEDLLAEDAVTEIMVIDPYTIYVERKGKIELSNTQFTDEESVRAVLERIVTPLGRRIDESTPLVDARLKDGSRVNAVIRPLALRGAAVTIRKFSRHPLATEDLIRFGTLTERMAKFLKRTVVARKNVVISGGTGSGKTTLLNVLSGAIPADERVVTIEDASELRLQQPHVVSLETRPPNMEGKGAYTIRDLVRNALRMRPDRIIVGECRAGEALDMLQAMNTGHDGSMTTTHANSPYEALARLETLCLMSGLDLPSRAIREQIASSVHIIVQQTRFSDGSRRITNIAEVTGIEDGQLHVQDIFAYQRLGTDANGKVLGEFRATGFLPSFLDEFIAMGLVRDGDYL